MADAADKPRPRVCIIGAGLAGLVSIKECLAENLEVTCFEGRGELGGQWAAQPDVTPQSAPETVQSSMYDGVVLNSCRDTSALPDFPLDPARYGDYFSHRHQLRYLREYAAHFGLEEHIRFRTKVLSCVPVVAGAGAGAGADDEDDDLGKGHKTRPEGGAGGKLVGPKWTVTVREEGKDEAEELVFDAVFVATGHTSKPLLPAWEGRDVFKGEFLHSHYYRRPGPFERKRVALVGFGSSAVDIACELAPGAAEVHLISRRGGYVLPRYVLGKPTEAWDNRATQVWVPLKVGQWVQTKLLHLVEGKAPKVMQPKHKILEQSPTVRGDFVEKVRTGVVTVHRGSVDRLTEDGIVIAPSPDDNGETKGKDKEELKVDVIIACTGYDSWDQPFLPKDVISSPDPDPAAATTTTDHIKRDNLYKLIVPPRYPSLFVIGHAELVGPAAPVFDAQARWASAVVSGRIDLPPTRAAMRDEIARRHAWQARHFVATERHALVLYSITYTDDLLAPLGADPSFRRCLARVFAPGEGFRNPWRAWQVLSAVWFGIPSAAQWRLFGHGADEALATETVLRIAAGGERLSEKEVRLLGLREASL